MASPRPLPNTFKSAWKVWSGKRISRFGTEMGGTHFPRRQRPENDRAVLIHIYLDSPKSWLLVAFYYYYFYYSSPPSLRFFFFCFSQFRSSSTALLCQMITGSPHPSAGAGGRARGRCSPPCAHGACCAERSERAQGMELSPGMGLCRSSHWLGTAGAPVRL